MGFKENWLRTDEVCSNCGAVTKRVRGITKQNVKRLFSFSFNLNEILIILMLIMVIGLAFVYKAETKQCREWLEPMQGSYEMCVWISDQKCNQLHNSLTNENPDLNFTISQDPWTS
jgi:hypothetical protein